MITAITFLQYFAVFLCLQAVRLQHIKSPTSQCTCKSEHLCKALATNPAVEVFGFATGKGKQYFGYGWSQLTTAAWRTDPEFVCYAHEHGVRVVYLAQSEPGGRDFDVTLLQNITWRKQWVAEQIQYALDNFLDGINFDAEREAFANDPFAKLYTLLVQETADAFHAQIPGSQVSVDIPWSPYGVDNRYFDWSGLANAADILFVMAYDMQSQIWGRCVASANSPVALVNKGLQQFIVELGISPQKIVLGLPWYGYMYPCYDSEQNRATVISPVCQIKQVGFRGSPCSDAAGWQKAFYDLYERYLYNGSEVQVYWDNIQKAPYFNLQNNEGQVDQVWFDNIESLKLKYELVNKWKLKGVGFWNLDLLEYNTDKVEAYKVTQEMWQAVSIVTSPPQFE